MEPFSVGELGRHVERFSREARNRGAYRRKDFDAFVMGNTKGEKLFEQPDSSQGICDTSSQIAHAVNWRTERPGDPSFFVICKFG